MGVDLYGITYALGVAVLFIRLLSRRNRRRTGLTPTSALNLFALFLVSFIFGARMLHVGASLLLSALHGGSLGGYYASRPLEIADLTKGGLSFHGGFGAAFVTCALAARRVGLDPMILADEATLWAPTVLAFGRVASFFVGVDPGRETHSSFGLIYAEWSGLRYPWQLIEAVLLVLVAQSSTLVSYRFADRRAGVVFWVFVFSYSVIRLVAEHFRVAGTIASLTIPQWLSMGLIPLSAGWLYINRSIFKPAQFAQDA